MWRRRGSESGFTLVETLVAIGIILTALLAMAYTATVGFGDIALAKVRQTATGLANQTIEEVRAIAFDRVTHGLANSDLSLGTDPNILANCEGSMTYCFRGEQIPHGSSSALPPLAPHQSSVVLGGVTYSISTYITNYLDDLTSNTYRLTVVVSWTPKVRGVLSTIELQTIVNSPSGCLSSATHPFAAPCQPFLYANAGSGEGSIQVTGSLQSVAFSDATLWAAQPNSNLQVEQISAVQGYSVSSGADLTTTSEQDLGRQRASSAADNDPSQPGLDFQTVSLPAQATGTLTASGGHNSISVTSSGGDTGSSTSTTSATISPSHPCPDTLGVNQTDGYPCGNSKTKQGGTMSSAAVLNDGTGNNSMNLGTATIASVAVPANSEIAYVNRDLASGDGLVHAQGVRYLGTVTLAGLPSAVPSPVGWSGYLVQITNFTDSATAETGISTAAPSVSASGTIKYWNGAGYTSLTIVKGASVPLVVAPVAVTYTPNGNGTPVVISITASLSTGGTATVDSSPSCLVPCTRTAASATSNSPLVGTITYKVTQGVVTVANLSIHVDFGALTANANYTPSPSAG